MIYETFKNELKLFLEGRLGGNASVFYQRDTILGNLQMLYISGPGNPVHIILQAWKPCVIWHP